MLSSHGKLLAMLFVSLLIVAVLILLITQAVRIEVTALLTIAALGLSGVLTADEALSGFANTATLTVAAMLILSAGLERTGVVDYLSTLLARRTQRGGAGLLGLLAIPTVVFSAFMSNTAVVALLIPVVLTVSRRSDASPSKLLLPLSFVSILGGTCTLIGTSTNILVDSLYRDAGGPGFSMFEFTWLGLAFVVVGGAFVVFVVSPKLPIRSSLGTLLHGASARSFVTEVTVPANSSLAGQTLRSVFGEGEENRVFELVRAEETRLAPPLDTVLEGGDLLIIEGTARTIHGLLDANKLKHGTAIADEERVPISRLDLQMVEAVITPNSRFLHRQVQDLGLTRKHRVHVLALRRRGKHHMYKLREFEIQAGDVLLLQGEPDALNALQDDNDLLLIEGVETTLTAPRRAPLAIGILLAVVSLAALNVAPILLLGVAGVAMMLLSGCLTVSNAMRALDTSVLLLLAGMIPLGRAMEKTGLASEIAEFVVRIAGAGGPIVLISAFYLLTNAISSVLSNNATALLLVPICLSISEALAMDPRPLLIAVAFGASASFATPIGYQTNTMVMGPGGYLFKDYLRAGVPLTLLTWIVASIGIPLIWPP